MGEEGGEGREEKVDVFEGKEDDKEGDVEERDVDGTAGGEAMEVEENDIKGNEEEDKDEDVVEEREGGKTIGREFGGLESHSEELSPAPNCSSDRMLSEGSWELMRGANGEP